MVLLGPSGHHLQPSFPGPLPSHRRLGTCKAVPSKMQSAMQACRELSGHLCMNSWKEEKRR